MSSWRSPEPVITTLYPVVIFTKFPGNRQSSPADTASNTEIQIYSLVIQHAASGHPSA